MEEKRGFGRREIERVVHIQRSDGQLVKCALADISRSGARITTEEPDLVEDECVMVIRDDLRRKCKVVVRSGNKIGLVFVSRVP
jgi:hypothetical protein